MEAVAEEAFNARSTREYSFASLPASTNMTSAGKRDEISRFSRRSASRKRNPASCNIRLISSEYPETVRNNTIVYFPLSTGIARFYKYVRHILSNKSICRSNLDTESSGTTATD